MRKERRERRGPSAEHASRPAGLRRVVYWLGRMLQVLGLLLIWWVLLLFAGINSMWPLLYWSLVAAFVFSLGSLGTAWARRGRRTPHRT